MQGLSNVVDQKQLRCVQLPRRYIIFMCEHKPERTREQVGNWSLEQDGEVSANRYRIGKTSVTHFCFLGNPKFGFTLLKTIPSLEEKLCHKNSPVFDCWVNFEWGASRHCLNSKRFHCQKLTFWRVQQRSHLLNFWAKAVQTQFGLSVWKNVVSISFRNSNLFAEEIPWILPEEDMK